MLIALAVFTILSAGIALVFYRWTYTPFGRMTIGSAITARKYALLSRFIDYEAPITQQRREQAINSMVKSQGKLSEIWRTEDRSIPGPEAELKLRLYWPNDSKSAPVLLFFHGGGFAYGNLDSHENLCRKLANDNSHLVIAVDYRLTPENPFPAATEDAYAALLWVAENITDLGGNPAHLSVAGDSAGGNLAAAVTLMARDRNGPGIEQQILLYPMLGADDFDEGSYGDLATGFMITTASLVVFWKLYAGELGNRKNPYFDPLSATDLGKLPEALIITAQFDPLRDGGELYANKLKEAGIGVTLYRAPGVLHGFMMNPARKPGSADEAAFSLVAEQLTTNA